jgi:N-acetylneuraminic acid mutarotase
MTASASFALNGKGYVVAGTQVIGGNKEVWEYDPAQNVWGRRSDFPYESFAAVSFVMNNKGYVGIGWGGGNEIWEYDAAADEWKKYCDFEGGGREAAEAFVVNGTAYIGLGTPTWTVYPRDFWKLTVE